jgi:hypothetical protein
VGVTVGDGVGVGVAVGLGVCSGALISGMYRLCPATARVRLDPLGRRCT